MAKPYLPIWLLCAIGLLPGMVSAQEDYLAMDLEQLLQVNVTGSTLRDESLKTVPSVVTVFTRQQLDTLGLDYLHELMRLVPGFQVNRSADNPLNYTFSASGRRLGSRAREVVLVVDGRIYVDPRSSGADSGLSLFPLANIERIEVIQGPGSALYGSGAFTGVINIVSRRRTNALSLALGSDERRRVDVHWSQESGAWQSSLYAHAYEDKGQTYQLANGQTTDDPRDELGVDLAVQYDNTRLQAAFYSVGAENFYVLEKVRNGFNGFQQTFRQLNLEHRFQPRHNWQTNVSLGYMDTDQRLDALLVSGGAFASISEPASSDAVLTKAFFSAKAYKANVTSDLTLSDQSSVQSGVDVQRARSQDANAYTNFDLEQIVKRDYPVTYYGNFDTPTVVEAATSRDTAGAYMQLLQDLGADTRLTLGMRYDYYEDIGNRLSPRLGLVHQLNPEHSLKLLYGEAFRAPAFAETKLMNNPFIAGNPDLQHEVVSTWSMVWVGTWGNTSSNLAAFYNDYQQPIVTGLDNGTRTYVNSSDQESRGLSLDIKQQIGSHWLMRASITRLIDLPDSAFVEAEGLGALIVNYHEGKWNWNLSASYQGKREYLLTANQRAPIASAWLANGQVSYQLNEVTRLRLTAKNLLDEDFASAPQGAGIVNGIPNRGREWSLGVDWHW